MSLNSRECFFWDRLFDLKKTRNTLEFKRRQEKSRAVNLGCLCNKRLSVFGKLRKILDQIALFTAKERDIISEINELERKHQFLRKRKRLKHIRPKQDTEPQHPYLAHHRNDEDTENNEGFWWFIFLLYLLAHRHGVARIDAPKAG